MYSLLLAGAYDPSSTLASLGASHICYEVKCKKYVGRISRDEALSLLNGFKYVVLEGHGLPDRISLDGRTVITAKDASEFSGKAVLAISCYAGKRLGREIYNSGGMFTGWTDKFTFISSTIGDPFDDRYARYFFEPILVHPRILAQGYPIDKAHLAMIDKWNEEINYWESQHRIEAPLMVMALLHDRDYQITYGHGRVELAASETPILTKILGFGILLAPVMVKKVR